MPAVDLDATLQQASARLSAASARVLWSLIESPQDRALAELRLTAPEDILNRSQQAALRRVEACRPACESGFASQSVLIMKLTRLCNLRCTYCNSWRSGPGQVMEFSVLAKSTRDIVLDQGVKSVDFVWHGGEVTLLPPSSLEVAIWLQERYRRAGVSIANSIQTNATRLTDDWLDTLARYGVSVGVSIDGPKDVHDARRVTKSGKGTWDEVKRGISLLKERNIPFGLLSVIDESILDIGPERYLEFLAECEASGVALLNALPANDPLSPNATSYLNWNRYQDFLRSCFRIWYSEYRSHFIIREFQALVDTVSTGQSGLCLFANNCMGQYLTIEPGGEVSACDKYIGDKEFIFGQVDPYSSKSLISATGNLSRAVSQVDGMKKSVSTCQYYGYCKGGCPHDTRINQSFLGKANEGCCGLDGLLHDIVEALNTSVH